MIINWISKKCADCGRKDGQLIINKFKISIFNNINPSEWLCVYHYRLYHEVKTDDFTTELDNKEFVELYKLSKTL